MSLRELLKGASIIRQDTSRDEVQELLRVAARSLSDAGVDGLSPEGCFALAYDALLQLATIPMRCHGYRTRGGGHHWAVFDALPELVDFDLGERQDYFQACRAKRSTAIYRRASVVTQAEVDELLAAAQELDGDIRRWLKRKFPQFA